MKAAATKIPGLRYGFRGSYPSPGAIDMVTVGGSTTDQRFVTEGKTWQDVLTKEAGTPRDKTTISASARVTIWPVHFRR